MSTRTEERPDTRTREELNSARPSKARYALILGGLTAFGPLSVDMYLPALPLMATDLDTIDSTLQLTLTAFVIGLALGQLVAGPLSDSLGRRRPLIVGVSVYVIASVLCAISPSVELLIAARALQAVGAAAGLVVARATVRDLFSGTEMTRFFSMLMLVTGLAPILAPLIGGQVLTVTSWRGIFLVLTGFGALLLIVAMVFLPEPLDVSRRSPVRIGSVLRAYLALLRERAFLGYALASGFLFAAMFAYISGSSFVLQGVYGLSPQQYSLAFGLGGVGIVVVGQVNGRIVGRFSERQLLATGLLLAMTSALGITAAAAFELSLAALLTPLLLMVSSIGLVMPNSTSLALANHPRNAGSASALLGVLQFLIGGLTAPLVGLGGQETALPMGILMASFAALALLSFATLARPTTR
ncbi:MFS transporter, DHA1 family, bicyclomycin/chloramphenicol resistance protein [Amycolatopsis marina]|uniref:MFS transporter, DHA1 family, bicyclomycin/chloramphenicol resistance protein n=1 Tax=Amycolatopsis marina TaxID=490629 RepID=A0A1I1C6S6_9PSEU|nr:Bcr/CflA family multidrug efflux MFS transporter [Amycolatopsis marina]SFB58339.1 MFS transporter, DHA1 family, bicyclomycin/chloramphenicol resistance protein [Amycolatopsis marina]